MRFRVIGALLAGFLLTAESAHASLITVGAFPATPSPSISIPSGTFLVPIEIQGAMSLQSWNFDLLFDASVVEEVDPGDGSSGIYGADFKPGDDTTQSFILGGFPFNFLGQVSGVAGSYPDPSLLDGVTGDGVLAYILFDFLPDQEGGNPAFAIDNPSVVEAVPEPPSLLLLAAGLAIIATLRRLRRQSSRS